MRFVCKYAIHVVNGGVIGNFYRLLSWQFWAICIGRAVLVTAHDWAIAK